MLNINAATDAFIPPVLVSELLAMMWNDKDRVEKVLKGTSVKIIYRHKTFEDSKAQGVDFNQDLDLTKVFLHSGMAMDEQKFYNTVKKDSKDPRSERITTGGGTRS